MEVLAVARDARLTTGALYHHFGSRQGLLHALLEDTAGWVAAKAAAAMHDVEDPWARLTLGAKAVLDACLEPAVRMTYNEAPSILGLEGWRELEASKSGALLLATLVQVEREGRLTSASLPLVATMLKGAIVEAAMWITQSETPETAHSEAVRLLERMLEAFVRR